MITQSGNANCHPYSGVLSSDCNTHILMNDSTYRLQPPFSALTDSPKLERLEVS